MKDDIAELVAKAMNVVEERKFVSRKRLVKLLHSAVGEFDEEAFWSGLKESTGETNARCKIADDESKAKAAVLLPDIVYSTSWFATTLYRDVYIAIGVELMRMILNKNWCGEGQYSTLNWRQLDAYDDGLMARCYSEHLWYDFKMKYLVLLADQHEFHAVIPLTEEADKKYHSGMYWLDQIKAMFLPVRERKIEYLKMAVDDFTESARAGNPLAEYRLGKLCEKNNPKRSKVYREVAIPGLKQLADFGSQEAYDFLVEIGVDGYNAREAEIAALKPEFERELQLAQNAAPKSEEQISHCKEVHALAMKLKVRGDKESLRQYEEFANFIADEVRGLK